MRLPKLAAPVGIVSAQTAQGRIEPSASGPCYFHHTCPADGYIGTMTKRQCRNYPGAHSWRNPRGGCENF